MSYSATTGKLGLPQWVKGTKDHPDFLTDMNQAFEKIDGFAERTDNTVDGLPQQVDELAALVESMEGDVGEHTTELATLGVRVGIQENNVANLGVRVGNLATRVGDLEERLRALEYMDVYIPDFTATLEKASGATFSIHMSRHGMFIYAWLTPDELLQLSSHKSEWWRLTRESVNMLRIPDGYTIDSISFGLATNNENPVAQYRFAGIAPAEYSDVKLAIFINTSDVEWDRKEPFAACTGVLVKEERYEKTCC